MADHVGAVMRVAFALVKSAGDPGVAALTLPLGEPLREACALFERLQRIRT